MEKNPFEEYVRLSVIHSRIATSIDGWQITDRPSLDLFKAIENASDTAVWAMEHQSSKKRPYLIALCREAKNEIPVWNVRARRQFDKNMIQWLNAKEAELEKAAEEKVLNANQQ